jgi:hypothetical protein
MTLGCLLPCIALALTLGGGQMCYVAISNKTQQTMTFQDFEKQPPDSKWLKLEHCKLDIIESAFSKTFGSAGAVFLPVHAVGDNTGKPAKVLLRTTDKDFMALAQGKGTDAKSTVETLKNIVALKPQDYTVEGLVMFGMDAKDKEREKITKLKLNLAQDFIMIDHHKAPAPVGLGIAMMAGGLLLFGFLGRRAAKKKA